MIFYNFIKYRSMYLSSIYLRVSSNLIIYLPNLSHLYLFYILFYFLCRSYGRFLLVFQEAGRFEMKNCISKVFHHHGRVILAVFKKCLPQFPVSTVYTFFKSNFLCRSMQASKTYICLYKKNLA